MVHFALVLVDDRIVDVGFVEICVHFKSPLWISIKAKLEHYDVYMLDIVS